LKKQTQLFDLIKTEDGMKFLITQIIVVILVCYFFAAVSNLTELGLSGWIVMGITGYALWRLFRQIHYDIKSADRRKKRLTETEHKNSFGKDADNSNKATDLLMLFMYDDATGK